MKVQAIIPAAGLGERLQSNVPKPFVVIHEKPILAHTLKVFEDCPLVESVIVVTHADALNNTEKIIKKFQLRKVSKIVPGGETRSVSVSNGLKMLDKNTDVVVVHDAARPFLSAQVLESAIRACGKHEAVIVAVPVKPTIKRVDSEKGVVLETLKREELWEVQTPQVFKTHLLCKAHEQNQNLNATDDASLVEGMGVSVKIVRGEYNNLKVTTREDIMIAEVFLKSLHER